MRLFVTVLLLVAFAAPAFAQDPGVPDTVRLASVGFDPSNQAIVPVTLVNDVPMSGIQIPLQFSNDLLVLDSVVFGARTSGFTGADIVRFDQNLGGSNQTVMLAIVPLQTGTIAVGSDAIATLYLSRNMISGADTAFIGVTSLMPAGGLLGGDTASQTNGYVPVFQGSAVYVPTAIFDHGTQLPGNFELSHNFPNPFNPSTALSVALPEPRHVVLDIYNLLGQRVRRLYDGPAPAGYLDLMWDGRDGSGRKVGSGVYFYKVEAGDFRQVRKMVLLK